MCRKCENDARVSGDPNDPMVLQQFWDQERAWYRDTINKNLNQLGRRVRDGARLRDGQEIATSAPPVRMFDVPNPGEVIMIANHFFERPAFDSLPALQAVYPDAHRTWPWEPNCHLSPRLQPMPGTFRG